MNTKQPSVKEYSEYKEVQNIRLSRITKCETKVSTNILLVDTFYVKEGVLLFWTEEYRHLSYIGSLRFVSVRMVRHIITYCRKRSDSCPFE